MHFSSVGGNYLKAQTQNNYAKARCELYQREITKKHVHSLAAINKNIRDLQDFLKDIKANSGYCKDIQEFSSLYQQNVGRPSAKSIQKEDETVDSNKSNDFGENKRSALSEQHFQGKMSDLHQPTRTATKTEFGVNQVEESLQLCDEKTKQRFVSETGFSLPAKNAIRTSKVSGYERGRRSYEMKEDTRNIKAAQRFVRDENLMERDRMNSGIITKNFESGASDLNSDFKELLGVQQENKMQRSHSSLQNAKNMFNGEENICIQNADNQLLEGKTYKSEPREAWTDRPLRKRESPTSLPKVGLTIGVDVTALSRSQTAPAKSSRLKQIKSASMSERKFNFTEISAASSSELKKLKIHVTISKTERRRILQELICNSSVTPDRSFLERERQILLKDKIGKFFDSLSEQEDGEQDKDEDDIFHDEEHLRHNKAGIDRFRRH